MNYWLHRISHLAELSYPLLEKNYLTIGFSDFTNEEFLNKVSNNDWKFMDEQFREKWGTLPRSRHSLCNFFRMKKGDLVIVPSWRSFYVCEIIDDRPLLIGDAFTSELKAWNGKLVSKTSDLLFDENGEKYDLGFARKVNILYSNISRDKFADARLTSRMKMRQTNANIDNLRLSIEHSIKNYKQNKPIHLHSIIVDKTANLVLEIIKENLNPDKFEKLIQTYFQTIGANDVKIPAKNESGKEGDADITATFENIKLIIYTQAKFQKEKISEFGTNQILDYKTNKESIDDGYNKIAWVITTADTFNEKAQNLAKENAIQLINGLEFAKMLLNTGISLLNSEIE